MKIGIRQMEIAGNTDIFFLIFKRTTAARTFLGKEYGDKITQNIS
ncbi:hypothetical protein [Sphingobacterium sp. E70]|nr:hypothetical protein [Sphingobacterium sp. E70]